MTITNEQVRDALALKEAWDRAYDAWEPDGPDVTETAMAELGLTDEAHANALLVLGARLVQARDVALDELAQVSLAMSLDDVRADRASAYARITEDHMEEWLPEVASETTAEAIRAMLTYLTTETSAIG